MTLVESVAAGQDGIVTLGQARSAGLATHEIESLVRAGRWRRLDRAIYLVDPVPDEAVPRRTRIRAAVASFGPAAVAVYGTAAELHGIAGLRRSDEIHISLPAELARSSRPTDPAVVVHQLVLPRHAVASGDGIPSTTPLWTVADLILRTDRRTAVSLLDSALNQELISDDEVLRIPGLIRGRRGAVAARRYLGEVDGRAQSPLETRVRLCCVDGRVPPDALQVDVRDSDGYLLGIGDLGWLKAKVIAEADGVGPHGTPEAVYEDRRRQNRMANAGWLVLRFTWDDTRRPGYIAYVVRSALAARQFPHYHC